MWSDWLVFCDCGFSLSALWWRRIRGLWKLPDGRDWLRWKLGLVLMDRAMFSKSLIQFSVDGWGCVPSLLFTWGQTMVEVMKTMATSFKRSHACTAALSAPNSAAGHHWPMPPPETPGHSWTSLRQSLVGTLSPGVWCTQASVVPSKSLFPQSCVSSGSSMVGLMVPPPRGLMPYPGLCTQRPYPCGRPLLTHISAGDTQTQCCLSLCGVLGSWCAQSMFEPSEHLWQVWVLILNVISPLLPSSGASPLPLDMGISAQLLFQLQVSKNA